MAETATAIKNSNGGEDDMLSLEEPAAMETADRDGEEPKAVHPSHQVNEENNEMIIISSDEEPATAEITAERTETPDNDCTEEPTKIDPAPQAAEESDGLFSEDEDPVAREVEERDHEAEIFAGFSLESNGIRFRGPRSGKTVRGEIKLLFVRAHKAFSNRPNNINILQYLKTDSVHS